MGYNRWVNKEFLIDGMPIEQVPMHRAAIHWDDEVLRNVCFAIIAQAVRDYKLMQSKGLEEMEYPSGHRVYMHEVKRFFNSSFFPCLLTVVAPNVDQGTACRTMRDYKFSRNLVGWGRGKLSDIRSGDGRRRWRNERC